jgi:hypothetical protein
VDAGPELTQQQIFAGVLILKSILPFTKYLHKISIEYLAEQALLVNSTDYEINLKKMNQAPPKISAQDVLNQPSLSGAYKAERGQVQEVTRMLDLSADLFFVVRGTVRITLKTTEFDSKTKCMELGEEDYIDGVQPLRAFKTQRLHSINKAVREMIVVAIEI